MQKRGLREHQDWHELKENGLVIKCKECHKSFLKRKNYGEHVRKVHKIYNAEPEIVLEEKKETEPDKEMEFKASKPQRGKWIVKLKRINIS